MTHVREDTHAALLLSGCRRERSGLEQIIEMKGCKLEYSRRVKWVAVRAKTERHLIFFVSDSLFPALAEDTRQIRPSLMGQEWSGRLWLTTGSDLCDTCCLYCFLELFVGSRHEWSTLLPKWKAPRYKGVSLRDPDSSPVLGNILCVHKYRLRCQKLRV